MRTILRMIILSLIVQSICYSKAVGQKPKKINVKGKYIHGKTKIEFPEKLLDYVRGNVYRHDKLKENISSTYTKRLNEKGTDITIHIYPNTSLTEDNLLDEYYISLQSIVNEAQQEISAQQEILEFKEGEYKLLGLYGELKISGKNTSLTLFECGKWFLKLKITSSLVDLEEIGKIRDELLQVYSPANLVKNHPVIPKHKIYIAPVSKQDKSILHAVLSGAMTKLKWIRENIDTLERCSGFPSLYLDCHKTTIIEMVKDWEKARKGKDLEKDIVFYSLKKIIDNGFIDELLFDEYGLQLKSTEEIKLEYDEYIKWKKEEIPSFDYSKKYFVLGYSKD